uniref:Uncharacterized protein n=1 Tax=Arundo donax TaxID=35708 RepID=A0A0A9FWQ1_ARUDO
MNDDYSNDSASVFMHNRRLTDCSPVTSPFVYVTNFFFSWFPLLLFLQYNLCLFRHVNLSPQMKLPSRYPDALVEEKETRERDCCYNFALCLFLGSHSCFCFFLVAYGILIISW